jgi:hypothetical protein
VARAGYLLSPIVSAFDTFSRLLQRQPHRPCKKRTWADEVDQQSLSEAGAEARRCQDHIASSALPPPLLLQAPPPCPYLAIIIEKQATTNQAPTAKQPRLGATKRLVRRVACGRVVDALRAASSEPSASVGLYVRARPDFNFNGRARSARVSRRGRHAARSGPRFAPLGFLLLAGYENLAAPNAIMQS